MRALLVVIVLTACATTSAHSRVAVTNVDREARVCLDQPAVRVGDQIQVHRRVCSFVPPKNIVRTCGDEVVTTVEVVSVADGHCATVAGPAAEQLRAGDQFVLASRR
jgi:hypothetical protein